MAWFSHLLDAYHPGRLGRAVDVRTTALDHASRKGSTAMSAPTHPTQPQPPQPTQQPPAWQPPPPEWAQATNPTPTPPPVNPQPKRRIGKIGRIAAVAVGGVLLLAIAYSAGTTDGKTDANPKSPAAAEQTSPTAPSPNFSDPGEEGVAPEPSITYDEPKVSDFKMKLRETSRENFGSAGDLVEFKLELVQVNAKSFDPAKTYDLKYQVTGDEDGPSTNTIEVQGDQYEDPGEDVISTYTGGKPKVRILSITEA